MSSNIKIGSNQMIANFPSIDTFFTACVSSIDKMDIIT